ncbi:unnamed protein product [Lymnaea stagnalis]|uniref:Uncharacterized protein n=1 Tax=Lymnaea stagnalis TaxID=6523 RepID=A0AAV2IIQ4_LYMST
MPAVDVGQTEYLRLHIVDLIGKQNSPQLYPLSKTGHVPKFIKLDQLENTQKFRQHFNRLAMNASRNVKGPVKVSHQNNPRLDLDVLPSPPTQLPPQPPVASATSTKNRAAAWLIKRFQKRQDRPSDCTAQPKNAKTAKPIGQLNLQDRIDVQSLEMGTSKSRGVESNHNVGVRDSVESVKMRGPLAADDRKSFNSNLASLKSDHEKLSHFTTLLLAKGSYENEAKSTIMSRNNRQNSENDIYLHRYNNFPKKDETGEEHESQKNKDGGPTTRPGLTSLEKRSGIFSASLENFKRRLLISTSKFSQILKEQLPKERRTTTDVKQCPPFKHLPQPPTQPARPPSRHPTTPNVEVVQQVGRVYQHIHRLESRTSYAGRPILDGTEVQKAKNEVENLDKPLVADPPEISKFSYRLKEKHDVKQDTVKGDHPHAARVDMSADCERPRPPTSVKQAVPVEMSANVERPVPNVLGKMTTPAPLTVHNIRLHESMQVAYERRMRRQTQHPRQLSTDSDSSTASAGDRMWQWLADVTVQPRPEPDDLEFKKHNTTPENMEIFV